MRLIDSLRTTRWAAIFVIYLRYLLGGTFVYAGLGKAMGGRFMPTGSLRLPPVDMTIDVFLRHYTEPACGGNSWGGVSYSPVSS